jgi:hypothetical protein
MYHFPLNRFVTAAVLYSLLLQSCQSGLHAITEGPVLERRYQTASDHVQGSGEASLSGSLALTSSCSDIRVRGTLSSKSPAESTTLLPASVVPALATVSRSVAALAAVTSVPQSFAGPFTASSGERVLFSQRGDRWQAVLAPGTRPYGNTHTLPVVSWGDVGALFAALQGQDIWSSRSRIHVLSVPHMYPGLCVYVGKLGLLGGAPARPVLPPVEKWIPGPSMTLGSNAEEKKIYYIPSGYRYKGYRLKEGSVIQYASLTANYVAASDEEGYNRTVATQNVHAAATSLAAHTGQVVTSGKPAGSVSGSSSVGDQGHPLKCTGHAGLVLYGCTKQDRPFGQGEIVIDKSKTDESKIDIQVEILVEQIGEVRLTPCEDVKPPAKGSLQSRASRSSSVEREYERRLALAEEESASCRVAYEKLRLQQEEVQKQSELAFKREIARLKAQLEQSKQQNIRLQARSTATMIPPQAFGAKEWSRYFGEIGSSPPLPDNIVGILNSPCPFWPDKEVKDTHLLVLIPATVNGKAFTLNLLGKLVKKTRGSGHSTQYFLYDDEVKQSLGDKCPSSSYWVLLTRDVLPGSRNEPYAAQHTLVAAQSSHVDQPPYAVPCVLEAATAILSHYVRSGTRLYKGVSDEFPSTSTRCAELLEDAAGHQSPITVGRFCARGLVFLSGFDDDTEFGVSCLRRFGTRHYRPSALLHSFGAEEWSRYFGEVGAAPPLPDHIVDTLSSACPFWTRKAVKDTHLLVLIPATVDGKPFNLNLLGELIKHPKGGGYSTGYSFYDSDVQRVLGNQSPTGSYWVLMTRDVLEDSRNRKYAAQEALVAERAGETELPYVLPGALEAATVILSHYVRSGERLYLDNPYTLTRCRDSVLYKGSDYPVAVGGFAPEGFLVHGSSIIDCSSSRGVSGLLRF